MSDIAMTLYMVGLVIMLLAFVMTCFSLNEKLTFSVLASGPLVMVAGAVTLFWM